MDNNKPAFMNRSLSEWLSSLPVLLLLLLTLVIGTGEMFHGQLLRMGERMFGDPSRNIQYFMLRADPVKPDCDPNQDIEAAVAAQTAAPAAATARATRWAAVFTDRTACFDTRLRRCSA